MSSAVFKLLNIEKGREPTIYIPDYIRKQRNIKVLVVCGVARAGKSTFLNTLLHILGEAHKFKTGSSESHCTTGIDGYYVAKHNILLLDCQGLAMGDTSNDHLLLLMCYLISDLFLYSIQGAINNTVFDRLTPMSMVEPFIGHVGTRPRLVFRISDYALDLDAAPRMLGALLEEQPDSYVTIRSAFRNLFDTAQAVAVTTEGLGRKDVDVLKKIHADPKADFGRWCKNEGRDDFLKAAHTIVELLKASPGIEGETFAAKCEFALRAVNDPATAGTLNMKDLDALGGAMYKKVHGFTSQYNKPEYTGKIAVDGSAASEALLATRAAENSAVFAEYEKQFGRVNAKDKEAFHAELSRYLDDPLVAALEEQREKAFTQMAAIVAPVPEHQVVVGDQEVAKHVVGTPAPVDWRAGIVNYFADIQTKVAHLDSAVGKQVEELRAAAVKQATLVVGETATHNRQRIRRVLERKDADTKAAAVKAASPGLARWLSPLTNYIYSVYGGAAKEFAAYAAANRPKSFTLSVRLTYSSDFGGGKWNVTTCGSAPREHDYSPEVLDFTKAQQDPRVLAAVRRERVAQLDNTVFYAYVGPDGSYNQGDVRGTFQPTMVDNKAGSRKAHLNATVMNVCKFTELPNVCVLQHGWHVYAWLPNSTLHKDFTEKFKSVVSGTQPSDGWYSREFVEATHGVRELMRYDKTSDEILEFFTTRPNTVQATSLDLKEFTPDAMAAAEAKAAAEAAASKRGKK